MGLETSTYINGLVSSNPTATDPKAQGDDHLRLIKSTLLATFPNITGAVTRTHTQLNTVPLTETNPVIIGSITEDVYTLSGTTPALEPDNGTIQVWALTGNSTPTDAIAAGQSMTLLVSDGTGYTVTWPSTTWVGGSAPTLATSGYSVIVLFKAASTLYGVHVGDVA